MFLQNKRGWGKGSIFITFPHKNLFAGTFRSLRRCVTQSLSQLFSKLEDTCAFGRVYGKNINNHNYHSQHIIVFSLVTLNRIIISNRRIHFAKEETKEQIFFYDQFFQYSFYSSQHVVSCAEK